VRSRKKFRNTIVSSTNESSTPLFVNTPINTTTSFSNTNNTTLSHRERLLQFYTKHNPAKLSTIDKTLTTYSGREDELFRKLTSKYIISPTIKCINKNSLLLPPPIKSKDDSKVYMDISSSNNIPLGRITYRLYNTTSPLASDNFRVLCTGEHKNKFLSYRHSTFHRIIPGFVLQGGDFTKHDGTGGTSIYSGTPHGDMFGKFKDEVPMVGHTKKYMLSMANSGPNTNGSQFFITLKEKLPHLDGKHVVFGEVVGGFDVVNRIESEYGVGGVGVGKVKVEGCGQLFDDENEAEKEDDSSSQGRGKGGGAISNFSSLALNNEMEEEIMA